MLFLYPEVYVQCTYSEKVDSPYGEWVGLPGLNEHGIQNAFLNVLRDSPIKDVAGWEMLKFRDFGVCPLGPPSFTDMWYRWRSITEDAKVHELFTTIYPDATCADFNTSYQGTWGSESAYSGWLFRDRYTVPDELEPYIDDDKFKEEIFTTHHAVRDRFGALHIFKPVPYHIACND